MDLSEQYILHFSLSASIAQREDGSIPPFLFSSYHLSFPLPFPLFPYYIFLARSVSDPLKPDYPSSQTTTMSSVGGNVQIENWLSKWIKPKNRYHSTRPHPTSTKAKTISNAKRTSSQVPTIMGHTTVEGANSVAGFSHSGLNILGILVFSTVLNWIHDMDKTTFSLLFNVTKMEE